VVNKDFRLIWSCDKNFGCCCFWLTV